MNSYAGILLILIVNQAFEFQIIPFGYITYIFK
jgi:hypothetical protein